MKSSRINDDLFFPFTINYNKVFDHFKEKRKIQIYYAGKSDESTSSDRDSEFEDVAEPLTKLTEPYKLKKQGHSHKKLTYFKNIKRLKKEPEVSAPKTELNRHEKLSGVGNECLKMMTPSTLLNRDPESCTCIGCRLLDKTDLSASSNDNFDALTCAFGEYNTPNLEELDCKDRNIRKISVMERYAGERDSYRADKLLKKMERALEDERLKPPAYGIFDLTWDVFQYINKFLSAVYGAFTRNALGRSKVVQSLSKQNSSQLIDTFPNVDQDLRMEEGDLEHDLPRFPKGGIHFRRFPLLIRHRLATDEDATCEEVASLQTEVAALDSLNNSEWESLPDEHPSPSKFNK